MGLNIVLENEQGQQIEKIIDSSNLLLAIIKNSKLPDSFCMRYIDPYGDTVFNKIQMDQFLIELSQLQKLSKNTKDHELLAKIRALALRCQQELHLYIKIYGD